MVRERDAALRTAIPDRRKLVLAAPTFAELE